MIFDPLYIILLIPGVLLASWASLKVNHAFRKYSRIPAQSRLSGAQVARLILDRNGLSDVPVERVTGHLSDHYDPKARRLRLSPEVHDSFSIAAQGIAAHEAGHALQHQAAYAPLQLRSALVPIAGFGSRFAWILIMIGLVMASAGTGGLMIAKLGVLLFATTVLFTLVTLPVEFNASTRAKAILTQQGMITIQEKSGVDAVLNAAAMTYVAGAVTAVLQLLYWVVRLGLIGGDD
ncbi:zinc metallopeptidase [bacterium]|nr:zinc metallopeptidase [candidate division CSSED10-310 bacterium]